MLLLAHIDVVEAKREDWTRDPLCSSRKTAISMAAVRGTTRPMAAIWTDTLVRFRRRLRAGRTIKMALTCGEETTLPSTAPNG